jgi:biopolymer transport protein ExbD
MKILILFSLLACYFSSCTISKPTLGTIYCYIHEDSILFHEGQFINPPTFKYKGSIKDESFFSKIKSELQRFNIREPNGNIIIKTIFFGTSTLEYPISLKNLFDSNSIKNVVVFLEYTEAEMKFFNIKNARPFDIKSEEIGLVDIEMKKDTIGVNENAIKFTINKSVFQIYKRNNLYKKVENIKLTDIKSSIEIFLKEQKIKNENFKFYIVANKEVQYRIVDKVMEVLTKNGIDDFKLVSIEE